MITPHTSIAPEIQICVNNVSQISIRNTSTSPRLCTVRNTTTAASRRPTDDANMIPAINDRQVCILHVIQLTCVNQESGAGHPTPLKNHKNIGFLSTTGPDPLKIRKLSSQHSMLGYHRPASETPFKRRFAGGPIMARF